MSLRKLLTVTIIVLFLLIFIGTLLISISNFRSYLINQVQTQTQNAATTLSFSLSQYANKQDTVTMRTMVDAVFETGNYQQITLTSVDGKTIISRTLENRKPPAPWWFVHLMAFYPEPSTAIVSAGWKQFGNIIISSSTGLVYEKLWTTSLALSSLFLVSFLITLGLMLFAVHYFLKPLNAVKAQAENISARNFTIVDKLPWTKELRSVVEVMNKLSCRVETLFTEQSQLTDKLRDQAYRDPLTKLGNRHYFTMQFEHILTEQEQGFDGALFLLEIQNFNKLKTSRGFEFAENYLLKIVQILQDFALQNGKTLVCRLSDVGFVLLQPNVSPADAAHMAKAITQELSSLQGNQEVICQVHIGVAIYKHDQSLSDLLSQADMALRAAQVRGNYDWFMYKAEEVEKLHIHSASQWKKILSDVIDNNKIILQYQPIYTFKGEQKSLLSYEVLIRIPDENEELLTAAHFIPMAESLNFMEALDKQVIEKVLKQLANADHSLNLSVNLSAYSILSKSFRTWLLSVLSEKAQLARRLTLEIPEPCINSNLALVKTFVNDLSDYHCAISIDQFGRGFSSLQYLRSLNVNNVKIDGSFTHHIDHNTENQFFVHTLTEIAHNIDIKVIAMSIENAAELAMMKTLAIDGYQGYFLARPSSDLIKM